MQPEMTIEKTTAVIGADAPLLKRIERHEIERKDLLEIAYLLVQRLSQDDLNLILENLSV